MQNKQQKIYIIFGIGVAVSIGILLLYPLNKVTSIDMESFSKDESDAITFAREFVENSSTFSFDGIKSSLILIQPIQTLQTSSTQYIIQFGFDSSHSGYGNRKDQILAQVITHHVAEITVSENKIISASLDGKWDEIKQIPIIPENSSLQITTNQSSYQKGQTIQIIITNVGSTRLFPQGWGYSITSNDGTRVAPNGVLNKMLVSISPGDTMLWAWDQLDSKGLQVNSGSYTITGSYTEEETGKNISNVVTFEIK